jgi:uncharacterized protein with HEPN domain
MNDQVKQRLLDALAASEAIPVFMGNTSLEEYKADYGRRLQIERLLEIVGEALNRTRLLDPGISVLIPEMTAIIGMRNRIIHGYDRVDDELVWTVARHNVVVLSEELRSLIQAREKD